jgi:hypothetical protein
VNILLNNSECSIYCKDHLEIHEEKTMKFSKRELKSRRKNRTERRKETRKKLNKVYR